MNTARKRSVAIRVAAIATAAIALTACTARTADDPAATPAEGSDQPIVIGASWPQSGPLGSVAPGLAGLEAYIQQVNDDGVQCIRVTDVIIVNGEETRAEKRMCRRPPARYAIAA